MALPPTPAHLALLHAAYWRESNYEFGAPEIDGKMPYGNSSVHADLAELLPHLDADERVQTHRELVDVLCWISTTEAAHKALLRVANGQPDDTDADLQHQLRIRQQDCDRTRDALLPILSKHPLTRDEVAAYDQSKLRAGWVAKQAADLIQHLIAEVDRLSARKQTEADGLKQRLGNAHTTLRRGAELRHDLRNQVVWLTSALHQVEDIAERGSRKGYDLDPDEVQAITNRGLRGRRCGNASVHGGCGRVPNHKDGHSKHPLTDEDKAAAAARGES